MISSFGLVNSYINNSYLSSSLSLSWWITSGTSIKLFFQIFKSLLLFIVSKDFTFWMDFLLGIKVLSNDYYFEIFFTFFLNKLIFGSGFDGDYCYEFFIGVWFSFSSALIFSVSIIAWRPILKLLRLFLFFVGEFYGENKRACGTF